MSIIRIVHLSDLHFRQTDGVLVKVLNMYRKWRGKRQLNKPIGVWNEVCDFLNNTVKPDAILITGDLTDKATDEEFEYAKDCLSKLTVNGDNQPYRIIPGNHDRFFYLGNTMKCISGIPGISRLAKDKRGRFSKTFEGARHITPTSPCDIHLKGRNIRIIGLDSSENDQWFAQGAVSQSSITAICESAERASKNLDLVIVLVHHHVLPIPEAEIKAMEKSLSAVANVTGLLNSGSLLDKLSKSHVNLVLHGHEHYRNLARFRSGEDQSSEVVVLAAGSGTGETTGYGWALKDLHFNVIEIYDNGDVWLREVKCVSKHLDFVPKRVSLLTAQDIRRSRFLRRYRTSSNGDNEDRASTAEQRGLPRSRLNKVIEFTLARDIKITEVRTDWTLQDTWKQPTRNASGYVRNARVKFEFKEEQSKNYVRKGVFLRKKDDPDEYKLGIQLDKNLARRKVLRVTSSWTWKGAAVLTSRELDMLPAVAKSGTRALNKEFAVIRVADESGGGNKAEFEMLTLTVRIPERFAPDPKSVEVCYENMNELGKLSPTEELKENLQFCGNGTIELHVPFPLPGYHYAITWPVKDISWVSDDAEFFLDIANMYADELLISVKSVLETESWYSTASIALYGLDPDNRFMLRRLGQVGTGPDSLPLMDARGPARIAWWGEMVLVLREETDDEKHFLSNEKYLAVVPIRKPEALGQEALGILRIGLSSNSYAILNQNYVIPWKKRFRAIIADAAYSVLQTALNKRSN